ncbi:intracellular growth attenuator family protein [Gilliamella sp. B2865]|uniref:IgaA/UmoB family intracellular growth attenuator n=1 Tax=unclassified Gilliamella TaxID=2685620 RepID=UPI00226AB6A9|nr:MULTISPECIES: IgaA/UmoB family intracellular growth attenuator [unclassified Gilliamella]MCX8671160.1 intracellular growth attenuator family protein [Gilliamella sp. B2785]MCX8680232.1 intracellular growth attenuator family protein [Gilliamella sp. B2865]
MLVIILFVIIFFAIAYFELSGPDFTEVKEPLINEKSLPEKYEFIRKHAIRQLTEEETLVLQSYLDNENNFTTPYHWENVLISSEVVKLKGYIEKDFTDETLNKYYYQMNNIRLFFPYNMDIGIRGFKERDPDLQETITYDINTVEIVFTYSYAVVVKINSYDLVQASLRLQARKQEQLYDFWQTGIFRPIRLNNIEKSNETLTQLVTETSEKKPLFEILSKREKNQFEIANQDRSNSGKLMTVFFVLGVMLLLALEHFQSIALVIFSIICFIFALIASSIKRKLPTKYVNHIKAPIRRSWSAYLNLTIDSSYDIFFPTYWEPFLPNNNIPIDMQIEVDTARVLSCGEHLSISEEVRNYGAPKFVHHNVMLSITGLILAVLIFFFTNAGEKLDFTYRQLTAPLTTWNIDDKVTLKQSAIQSMDRVNLNLSSVSCDIHNIQNIKKHYFQCNKIFVNLNPIDSNKLSLFPSWPQYLQTIYSENLIKMKKDDEVHEITLAKRLNKLIGNYRYSHRYNPQYKPNSQDTSELIKIYDISKAILIINDGCNHSNLEPCEEIKNSLASLLPNGNLTDNWSEVVAYAKLHPDMEKIVTLSSAKKLDRLVAKYRTWLLKQLADKAKQQVVMLQNDANNLSIQLTNLIPLYDQNYIYSNGNFKEQLDYYNNILLGNSANLKITGIVTKVSYHNGEISKLTLSTDYGNDIDKNQLFSSPILINNFVFLFVIFIALINTIIYIWKKAANQFRLEKIISHYQDKILEYND